MTTALERRFIRFLSSIPESESLDELLMGPEYDGERRADFLLFGRKVIVEIKSLEVDASPKVEIEMDKHRDRDDFPVFYGEVELQKVLKHLPDGEKINQQVFYRITRSVEDGVRSAEEQLQNTARLLELPESAGILVLLNESVEVLSPDVVAARVSMLMSRKTEDGSDRSPIVIAWILFDSHFATNGPAEKTLPMVVIAGAKSKSFGWLDETMNYLQGAWAAFNGYPLISAEDTSLAQLGIVPASTLKSPKADDKITRQKMWELRYKDKPYLRNMSDSEVLSIGKRLVEELTPYLTVGSSKVVPAEIDKILNQWSDFNCEARHRGINLRHMKEA